MRNLVNNNNCKTTTAVLKSREQSRIWAFLSFLLVFGVLFAFPVLASDPFAAAKDEVISTVGKDSTIQWVILVVGFLIAVVAGFITKDWPKAIAGFVVGMIFINIGLKITGLA